VIPASGTLCDVDALDLLMLPARPFKALCRVPQDLREVTVIGDETTPRDVAATPEGVRQVWAAAEAMYRTGLYPALQLCIRRHGSVVLHRALGHASGNGPTDPQDAPRTPVSLDTPFLLYSASKAITAMVIHKLDEQRQLHLDDRVSDYVPAFEVGRKRWITIRQVLAHRAGIPNLPPGAMDLGLLDQPQRVVDLLAAAEPTFRPGRRLAYHAVSGGFVLAEVVRRATGEDIRQVLRKQIAEPLGLRWLSYGAAGEDADRVARDDVTGLPVWPPFSWAFRRALGTGFRDAVRIANDRRFLEGIVPSANAVATAAELSAFYQCLLDEGELEGVRVFDKRTIRHATSEQAYWDLDFTLGVPVRYGLGFMLGGEVSLFGLRTPRAFGHLGFTNIFTWADPDRRLAVALLTSGKAFLSLDLARLVALIVQIGRAFPPF
jgi:CubicO group peptidase (beta-lactamase class C family)